MEHASRPRFTKRARLSVVAAVWLLVIHVLVPLLHRVVDASRVLGRSAALTPGDEPASLRNHFLAWNAYAWKLDILVAYAALLYLSRRPLARVWNRLVHRESGANSHSIVATAAVFGLASGMVQGLHTFISIVFSGLTEATLLQSAEAIWMAPLGESVSMLALAFVFVIITRAWRRPVTWRLVVLVFGSLAAYGIIRSMRIGIATAPAWLLAIGFSVQVGRMVAARADAFRQRLPALVVAGLIWILASAVLLHGGRALRERTSLRRPPASGNRPSVILFILDTVRASNLSLYGHEHATTPRLVELAKTSAVVNGAAAVSSWTLPSHAAMLTGQLSSALNVDWTKPLGNEYPTLAEELSRRGYATGGFSANYVFAGRAAGIARGFSHFVDAPISLDMVSENCWLLGVMFAYSRWLFRMQVHPQRDADNISDAFLRWARRQDRPYFAMLNFKDAHTPYLSPDSILLRFVDHPPFNNYVFGKELTPDQLRDLHSAYDAAIAFIDQEIGRIVDTLNDWRVLDRTVLIVTADHGEQLGERAANLTGHGNSLYASSLIVPLLIRAPGRVPGGARIKRTVSTARIAATIGQVTDGANSTIFPGVSIAAEFQDRVATQADNDPVVSYLKARPIDLPTLPVAAGPMASALWGQWHYIRNGNGAEELYDLALDPWERNDVLNDPSALSALNQLRPTVDKLKAFGIAQVRER